MLSSSSLRYSLIACTALLGAYACSAVIPDAIVPPPPIDAQAPTTSQVETFAIDNVFAGETDRSGGAASNVAWKNYGYDLDGLITTVDASNVCDLQLLAAQTTRVDGIGGIDNAWGAGVLPIVEGAAVLQTPSEFEDDAIHAGVWTLQIQTTGLPNTVTPTVGITAQIFTSNAFDQGTPAFDSTTDWPVATSSLADNATLAGGATVQFHDAYVTANGLFVSGTPSPQPLLIPVHFLGAVTVLRIHHAVITFTRSGTHLLDGTVAGVLDTTELVDAFHKAAGVLSKSLCGSAFDNITDQIRQQQDILSDGTNAPGVPCNAISIGVGFTARQIANPTKVSSTPLETPDPCDASTE